MQNERRREYSKSGRSTVDNAMPRAGALTFGDLDGKLAVLEIVW
jgi:hypothetical protein